jgi:hypothetical protein
MKTANSIILFLRSKALWVGLIAVIVPLLVNLGLQYRSLSELESAMPWARRMMLRKYLQELNTDLSKAYKTSADEILNVPAEAFQPFDQKVVYDHFAKLDFPEPFSP